MKKTKKLIYKLIFITFFILLIIQAITSNFISNTLNYQKQANVSYVAKQINLSITDIVTLLIALEFLIILFTLGFLYFYFKKAIDKPMNDIVTYLSNYNITAPDKMLEVYDNYDFKIIVNHINDMTTRAKQTTQDIYNMQSTMYDLEIEKYKIELQALQNQINPHFLYNSLECIRSIAIVKIL